VTSTSPLRSTARQARSAATFEAIVAAAGELFDGVGPDATSTEDIARRAGVSIGSVYRFFDNRSAIEAVIAERFRAQLLASMSALFSRDLASLDLETINRRFTDAVRDALMGVPGSRSLLPRVLGQPDRGGLERSIRQLQRFIERQVPGLPATRARSAAQTYVTTTIALIIAAGPSRNLDRRLVEIRSVLIGYIRQLQHESGSPTA
jgi:AcrR family transcriptional regulator